MKQGLLMGAAVLSLAGCGAQCNGGDCFSDAAHNGTNTGTGGTSSTPTPGTPTTTLPPTAGIWRGSADIVGMGKRSVVLVSDGSVWRYLISESGQSVALYFDNLATSKKADAFIHPEKGEALSDGSTIDSGSAVGGFIDAKNLSATIDFSSTGDQSMTATLDQSATNLDANVTVIAGHYVGTAADGTRYVFDIDTDTDFVGTDSNGCKYNLTTTSRDSNNIYSSAGPYDPVCDTGGANFINAAFWEQDFKTTTWFVGFRGVDFVLHLTRQ